MTIETGNATHATRHAKHPDAHKGARGQQPAGDTAIGADFMAILAGLGGEDTALGGLTAGELDASLDPGLAAPCMDPLAGAVMVDPGVEPLSRQGASNLAMAMPSTAAPGVSVLASGEGDVAARGLSKSLTDSAPVGGLRTASLPLVAEGSDLALPVGEAVNSVADILEHAQIALPPRVSTPVGSGPKEPGFLASTAADRAAAKEPTLALGADAKGLVPGKDAKPVKPLAVDTGVLYSKEMQAVGVNTRSEAIEHKLQAPLVGASEMQGAALPAAMAAAPEFNGVLRESTRARFAEKRSSADTLAASVAPAPTPLGVDAASIPAPTEMVIAEKVAYWLSNDVQKAELKLDGLGELPVEVSIRLQGNEAHVAFRTDELQARNALEQAGTALKDLLQREGLMLAGVSVGTTGGGEGRDDPNRNGRSPTRKGSVELVVGPDATPTRPRGLTVGRSLDLFV